MLFLCTDYKIPSKVLSNRLKVFIELLVGAEQSYCVPDRSILDNLFLIRDIFSVCKLYKVNTGTISIDQEKAYDHVDHPFLFSTLQAFGVGERFLYWIKLLYSEASCVIKAGGGLSCPVPVRRGIRQGCPILGQLYSMVEPLLCRLRNRLVGLILPLLANEPRVVVLAYADDVNVFIQGKEDVLFLQESFVRKMEMATTSAVLQGESSDCQQPGRFVSGIN